MFCCIQCKKENFYSEEPLVDFQDETHGYFEGQMILGEQLENPYSVENMQIAYDNLQKENSLKSTINIKATHLYVRFRPKDFKELDVITRDTTLDVFDYPLDVEIKRGGTHYHDPTIPRDEITWQYTVVPVDYKFPNVKHQKLAKLYLPEDGKVLRKVKSANNDYFDWIKLETEALRITNNLEEGEDEESILKSGSWIPAGTIRVWDDVIDSYSTTIKVFDYWEYYNCSDDEPGDPSEETDADDCRRAIYRNETSSVNSHFIPLEGVEVRATRWFTTHKGFTNADGEFQCDGSFDRAATYSIKWERWDFDIRDRWWGQAYFNGPKQIGYWNLNIEESGTPKSFNIAHIFRAAHTYYYKHNNWGIKAPPRRDGILQLVQHRLHIASLDGPGTSSYLTFKNFIQAAQISVHDNGNSQRLFATTIHELAHASHWELGYSTMQYCIDWIFNKALIPESWAQCVEHIITSDIYGNSWEDLQSETVSSLSSTGYTPLFIDLIDDVNQRDERGTLCPIDRVEGYSIAELEHVLDKTYIDLIGLQIAEPLYESFAISIYKNKLRDLYSNPTEMYINELFSNYY